VIASKVMSVSSTGAFISADLGDSSKYTSETLVGRSGKGFHVNIIWL